MQQAPAAQSCKNFEWLRPQAVEEMLSRVQRYSMVPRESLVELTAQVGAMLFDDVPGDIVECGVWRGGSALLMADCLRRAGISDRKVWLCDSFQGLPAPAEIDGEAALRFASDTDNPRYRNNCLATLDDVQEIARSLGLIDHVEFVQGWFDTTLPVLRSRIGAIALLRIDADWYSSVRCCLDNLYDVVAEGGLVVFDDYHAYEGCAIAVHEFLGDRKLGHVLEGFSFESAEITSYHGAVFRKGRSTWQSLQNRFAPRREVDAIVPAGTPFILVDEQVYGWDAIPFLEHDGGYWGPPADSLTAIEELERLRDAGAAFIVFGWPGYWWLDHYADFARHLEKRARCCLRSKYVVIFDLRS
jgi:O-methyltransferase